MKKLIIIALLLMLLSACGAGDADSGDTDFVVEELVVEIQTPEQVGAGQKVALIAKVTQGDEVVEDADEVIFEVWQSGSRDDSEMLEAKHVGDGIYRAQTTFEEGLYFTYAHTTARQLHVMPKHQITAGNPDPASIVPDGSSETDNMKNMEKHKGH
ncbi:MAG TPA: FixH family protein [Planococcus sp. (in: firmicutes)]|nr:FixH family protein [Planococcus sp. (in: firmicutes)]